MRSCGLALTAVNNGASRSCRTARDRNAVQQYRPAVYRDAQLVPWVSLRRPAAAQPRPCAHGMHHPSASQPLKLRQLPTRLSVAGVTHKPAAICGGSPRPPKAARVWTGTSPRGAGGPPPSPPQCRGTPQRHPRPPLVFWWLVRWSRLLVVLLAVVLLAGVAGGVPVWCCSFPLPLVEQRSCEHRQPTRTACNTRGHRPWWAACTLFHSVTPARCISKLNSAPNQLNQTSSIAALRAAWPDRTPITAATPHPSALSAISPRSCLHSRLLPPCRRRQHDVHPVLQPRYLPP